MYKKGDFHIHTTFSDGCFTPSEILNKAQKRNLDIISITDHNSIDGVKEAIDNGNKIGIKVIPGVEVSARYEGIRVHVLGYFPYDVYDKMFIEALKYVGCHNNKGFNNIMNDIFSSSYRRDHISVENAIKLLKHFGAVVILAHPVMLPREKFKSIVSLGFHGLEAKYCKNTDLDTKYFINYAKNHNMIYTAGSDFHTEMELYRAHGNLGEVFLDESEINNFLEFLYKER